MEVGRYTVTASASGYSEESSGATISENTTTSVNFGLATAPVVDVALTAVGYKVKGVMKADLSWSGGTMSGNVDVYRNGIIMVTTTNDGTHTDNINQKGSGTFAYKVCEAGTNVCSNESVVVF